MENKTVSLVSFCMCIVCITCTLYIIWTLEDLRKLRATISANCKCAHASSIQVNDLRETLYDKNNDKLSGRIHFILNDRSKTPTHLRIKRQTENCKNLKKKWKQCRKKRKNQNKNKRRTSKREKGAKTQKKDIKAGTTIMKTNKEKTKVTWKADLEFYSTKSSVSNAEGDSCTLKWEGTFCHQNDTYWNKDQNTRIKFLQRVPWNDDLQPNLVKLNKDGSFSVEVSGLYIVFFQTAIFNPQNNNGNHNNMETLALMHYRNDKNLMTKLTCMKGSENPDMTKFHFYYPHYTSCTISSVLYMRKNDFVSLLLLRPETVIDISPNTTYFGLVLLS